MTRRTRLFFEALEDRRTPSFSPAASYPVGANPREVVTGDFNGDGHLDLATANTVEDIQTVSGTVSVLPGDGAGGFGTAIDSDVGAVFYHSGDVHEAGIALTVADFDNDGRLDLATASYFSNETGGFYGVVGVNLGNGDGTFQGTTYPLSYGIVLSVVAGDFNNDSNSDLAVTSLGVNLSGEYYGEHDVLLGNGQGGFTEVQPGYGHPADALMSPAVGDLNRDGNLDVVTAFGAFGQGGEVFLGSEGGGLYLHSTYYTNQNARAVAIGDFTGDGIPDLVVAGNAYFLEDAGVEIVTGRGDGTFNSPIANAANGNWHTGVAVADFNGDGLLDAVTSDADTGTVNELRGNGNGTLTDAGAYAVGSVPSAVAVGDFNGDGRPDVAAVNAGSNSVSVLLNDGTWAPPPPPPPRLRIADAPAVTEGHTGTRTAAFTVTLSAASSQAVTIAYATGDGSAGAGSDYQAASGTLTFAPGETRKTLTVLVTGDRSGEPNETFVVNLSSPTNATIADGQGVGTVLDDEPRVSVSDVSKKEGRKNQTTLFTFTVTLSAAYDQPVTVSFRTTDGSATTADSDYVARTGTLTFAPGETTKTITIEVKGDNKKEADETFYLDLFGNSGNALLVDGRGVGTIVNDD